MRRVAGRLIVQVLQPGSTASAADAATWRRILGRRGMAREAAAARVTTQ